MKVVNSYCNFSRAKIDHDALGRFDLPIYTSGCDVFRNFESNYKGNAIYRCGWERMLGFEDCALTEFKFSLNQNYIVVMLASKFRFLSYDSNGNFGWVLDGSSNILEVASPYTLAQCKYIALGKPTQNADVMIITHSAGAPRSLKRVSANSFTLGAHVFNGISPFQARTVNITAITQADPAVVTSNGHSLRSGDTVTITAVGGMTQLNGNSYLIDVVSANTFSLRGVDSTGYGAYTSGGQAARAVDNPDNALFYRGRLYFSTTPRRLTTVWGSASGQYDTFALPTTNTATSPLQFTIADITQRIEWLFGGDNSLIAGTGEAIVAINGGGVGSAITAGSVEATITSADGCNRTYPLRKDGLIFYVGQNARNTYYFRYDLLTESFVADDANLVSFDITKGGFNKMRYKKDRNDLICFKRADKDLVTLNFKERENIVGWHEHQSVGIMQDMALITDNNGAPQLFALMVFENAFYIERQAVGVEFAKRVDFFSGKDNKAADDMAYARYVAEQMRGCIYLDDAVTYSDRRSGGFGTNSLYYMGNVAAGSVGKLKGLLIGPNIFTSNDVGKHVVMRTLTGYESGRFEITNYVGTKEVDVRVLQELVTPFFTTISSGPDAGTWPSFDDWYLSFTRLTGITGFDDLTVGVVADGGYLGDMTITGGELNFPSQITSVVFGHRYKGQIKSFSLGFTVQGANTQGTLKLINRVGIRAVSSAGGEVGSSLYELEDVQELTGNELNYLPPIPIDGTKFIPYTDDSEFDKYFYIVQDKPLPFCVAAAMVEAQYAEFS